MSHLQYARLNAHLVQSSVFENDTPKILQRRCFDRAFNGCTRDTSFIALPFFLTSAKRGHEHTHSVRVLYEMYAATELPKGRINRPVAYSVVVAYSHISEAAHTPHFFNLYCEFINLEIYSLRENPESALDAIPKIATLWSNSYFSPHRCPLKRLKILAIEAPHWLTPSQGHKVPGRIVLLFMLLSLHSWLNIQASAWRFPILNGCTNPVVFQFPYSSMLDY